MKTLPVLVVVFLVVFLSDDASAYGRQTTYRWRNDDGDVYTASWKSSLNTPLVMTKEESIRLRIGSTIRGNDSYALSLRYTEDPRFGVWLPITSLDTGKFVFSPSVFIRHALTFRDNQLLPPANPDYTYRATIAFDSLISFDLAAEKNSLYELEYCIRPTPLVEPGSAFFFASFFNNEMATDPPDRGPAVLLTPPVHWRQHSVGTWCTLQGIAVLDAATYVAVGGGSPGVVFRSTDGGTTWRNQSTLPCDDLNAVTFVDANVGFAVGTNGTIARTTDAGLTWEVTASIGGDRTFRAVAFANHDIGEIVGYGYSGSGEMWRTTNGGMSWTNQMCSLPRVLNAVAFAGSDVGFVVGSNGTMLYTNDGGRSWFPKTAGFPDPGNVELSSVYFSDASNGTAVGGEPGPAKGVILRTTDAGNNWTLQSNAGAPGLRTVFFVDQHTGWTAGYGGWMLKTTNGGLDWRKLTTGIHKDVYALAFADQEAGLAVGEDGTVVTTSTGGATSVDFTDHEKIPAAPTLLQNYPNPFNGISKFAFLISELCWVTLKVHDLLGREVGTLVNEQKAPGNYTVQWEATGLPSGVYLYRMTAGTLSFTKKLLVLK